MMNRSLVTKKSFRLPKALEKLFDNPPLVGNERREDYDAFCLEIEIALGPTDFILWMQIREFANISWELQRERRIKAGIITLKQQEARIQLGIGMTRADFERQKLEMQIRARSRSEIRSRRITMNPSRGCRKPTPSVTAKSTLSTCGSHLTCFGAMLS
jgi:hypothetical protein